MEESIESAVRMVDRDARNIEIVLNNAVISFPLNVVPDKLYQTMAAAADGDIDPMEKIEHIYQSHVMKPSVCTFDSTNFTFPINAATKIVRLTHKDDVIEDLLDEIEGEILSLQGRPFEETIEERFELYRELYVDDAKIDRVRLGAIEMYGDVTYSNLRRDPRVTLQFDWRSRIENENHSYQLNCIAEILPIGSTFYRYMRVLRTLFSSRFFNLDLNRADYVAAYKFWICEWRDKSLISKTGFT